MNLNWLKLSRATSLHSFVNNEAVGDLSTQSRRVSVYSRRFENLGFCEANIHSLEFQTLVDPTV
jgi:hypothetical protein